MTIQPEDQSQDQSQDQDPNYQVPTLDKYKYNYEPRAQFMPYHHRTQRFSVIIAHRRAGKTIALLNDIIVRAMVKRPDGLPTQFAMMLPTAAQARKVAWAYLKAYTSFMSSFKAYKSLEQYLTISLPDPENPSKVMATIMLVGAENAENLRGLFLDGMVLDEAADVSPYVINQIIRPALADREGWLTISGTVKSIDDYLNVSYNTALKHPESYFTMMLKASESGILPERELLSLQQGMTEEAYQVEFECNVNAAVTGKILLPYLTQKQVTKVPYDPAGSAPITSWDLGMSDATSIWVLQMCGREPHLLDYYENTGKGLEHYVQWLSKLPYANRLGAHILPHDSKVRELGSGVSRIQLLRGMGLRNIKVAPRLPKDQQIEAARMLLPKCWVDEDNCKDGLKAIRNYSFEYDNKRQVLSQTPLHNQWSNGADAFETLAVGLRRGNTASDGIGGNDDYTFGSPIEALDNDIPVAVMYEELDTESWA